MTQPLDRQSSKGCFCDPLCDFCQFYAFNGDERGLYTGNGRCEHPKHPRPSEPFDGCDDYQCGYCAVPQTSARTTLEPGRRPCDAAPGSGEEGDTPRPTTRIVVREREGIAQGEVYPMRKPRAMYEAVLRADPCAYCGAPGGTLDHIVPRAKKGRDLVDNLSGACARCNHRKGSQSLLEYVGGHMFPAAPGPPKPRRPMRRVTREERQSERDSPQAKVRKRTRWDALR